MKLGLISDVHGNWQALKVALDLFREQEKVDKLLNCGDVVGYGPEPGRCVEAMVDFPAISVRGNHDAGLLGDLGLDFFNDAAKEALNWTRDKLNSRNQGYLDGLPEERYLEEFDVSMVHGSSVNPLTHYIAGKREAFQSLRKAGSDFNLQIFGHTHLPALYEVNDNNVKQYETGAGREFTFEAGKQYLVNPGGVGQPRDGNWKTSFAVLELGDKREPQKVKFYRKEYPAELTRQKILDAGLPKRLGDRLLRGR